MANTKDVEKDRAMAVLLVEGLRVGEQQEAVGRDTGKAIQRKQHARLASDGLRFRRVTRGEQQVVSGMNYRLFVDAADGSGNSAPYVAEVYEQSWTNTRQLTSFKPAAN
ncbi:hypothetical protein VPH35_019413 [Triticum aestivum]